MRALVLIGVLIGAGYTASLWLGIEHIERHKSFWNVLSLPIVVGSVIIVYLFLAVLADAYERDHLGGGR